MECWYARNACEHKIQYDPIKQCKETIVEKIIWLLETGNDKVPAKYKGMKHEALMRMPQENLCIMEEQIRKVIQKK
jgi:hypothetical protein